MEGTTIPEEPLRERIPGYLVVFAMGVGAGVVIGVIVWLATAVGLVESSGTPSSAWGRCCCSPEERGAGAIRIWGSGRWRPSSGAATDRRTTT